MAGFFRKLFSFGKKEVVEKPADETLPAADIPAEAGPPATDEPLTAAPGIAAPEPFADLPEPSPAAIPAPEPELPEPVRLEEHPVAEPDAPAPAVIARLPAEPPLPGLDESVAPIAPEFQAQVATEIETPPISTIAEPAPHPAAEMLRAESAPPRRGGKVAVGKAVEAVEPKAPEPAPEPKKRWFQRLREGLSRSSRDLTASVAGVFTKRKLDEDTLEELEEVLIRADLGAETAIRISGALAEGRFGRDISDAEVRAVMASEIERVLGPVARPLELDLSHKPHVVLVVGVNGTGKTTTIGKLAAKLRAGGLDVMLAAGDTFRAAAIEQLHIWGERTGATVISNKLGADAAGLAFDAYEKAKAAGADVLIVDTAGRLQNRAELMAELEKIVRVLGKLDPEAPHTVLQTLDATTGQNALNQVEIFRNVAGVNGLVMTKLDGTARGGILVAIAAKHKLPVYFIGVGEGVDDLEPFAAKDFAEAIAGVGA